MSKTTRRKQAKRPSLSKQYNSRIRQEYIDYDYLGSLTEDQLNFLNDFTSEYYNASVGKQKDLGKNNRFMKTVEDIKDCTDRNNKRNACIYGKSRGNKQLVSADISEIEELYESKEAKPNYMEDSLIAIIDSKTDKD